MSSKANGNSGAGHGWLLLIIALILYGVFSRESSQDSAIAPSSRQAQHSRARDAESLSRDEAIESHWDEICEHLQGSEAVEACDMGSGNCYELDADISSCAIETVHFPNGGFLSVFATIDDSGSASDFDSRGRMWDFTLDMNSSLIDQAIDDWAASAGVRVDQ